MGGFSQRSRGRRRGVGKLLAAHSGIVSQWLRKFSRCVLFLGGVLRRQNIGSENRKADGSYGPFALRSTEISTGERTKNVEDSYSYLLQTERPSSCNCGLSQRNRYPAALPRSSSREFRLRLLYSTSDGTPIQNQLSARARNYLGLPRPYASYFSAKSFKMGLSGRLP